MENQPRIKSKVVFVSEGHLTPRTFRDWGIGYLLAQGASVEYWDLVSVLRPAYDEPHRTDESFVVHVQSMAHFHDLLKLQENSGAHFFVVMNYDGGRTTPVFKLLSELGCRTYFIAWGAMPIYDPSKVARIRRLASNPAWLLKTIRQKLMARALVASGGVAPFDVAFVAGEAAVAQQNAKRIVPINYADFDEYARIASAPGKKAPTKTAVFLDQFLPHHTDYDLIGWPRINSKPYYAAMRRLFNLVEEKHGLKVIVAAHPRSNYQSGEFGDREIIIGKTAELVRDSALVIAHDSSSVSFAVLFAKPVIVAYTNEMAKTYRHTEMRIIMSLAKYLGVQPVNADSVTLSEIDGQMNIDRYKEYKTNYLATEESEGRTSNQIIWETLCAIDGEPAALSYPPQIRTLT
jgi:hypothetical protein